MNTTNRPMNAPKRPIKVLFLPQYSDKGSPGAQMRIYNYLPLLKKEGIECKVSPGQRYRYFHNHKVIKIATIAVLTTIKRAYDIFRVRKYDVVYFYREVYQTSVFPFFEWIYSRLNKNIVFDFDDAIYLENRYIPKILGWSKEIVVGNRNLKEFAVKHSGESSGGSNSRSNSHDSKRSESITIIPTPIREDDVRLSKKYRAGKKNEKITIGWIGNVEPHLANLQIVKNVIKKLCFEYSIEFRIAGSLGNKNIEKMYSDVPYTNIIHSVDVLQSQKEIVKFDIGIMPLEDNEWNAGKCAKKLLDYMGAGLATVSSPVGMNADIVQDGKNGFLARSEKEWHDKLEKLIIDFQVRKKMGEAAQKTVREKYLLVPCAKKLIEVLRRAAKE